MDKHRRHFIAFFALRKTIFTPKTTTMKNLNLLLISVVVLVATSCNPKYYSPNTQNVPLMSAKGEKNLTLSGNGNQIEFQGAYAVTNNVAIKADASFFFPPKVNGDGGSGNLVEVGGGYFKRVNENFVFETYGVLGFGSFENNLPSTIAANPSTTGKISANILRSGIQPNFGYKSKNFSAAISSRLVNLNYTNIKGDLVFAGTSQTAYLNNNSSNFMVEPAITLRAGFEKLKLQLQYGYSVNLSNSEFRQDKDYLTLGINFNFR